MKKHLKPTLLISGLTLLSQFISFLIQAVIARYFGAQGAADAYWVGITFPQYVTTIMVQSLGLVFLPVFVEHFEKNDEPGAWSLAIGLLGWTTVVLGVICAIGFSLAGVILRATAPGLNQEIFDVAKIIARWAWVAVLPTAWANILSSVYQARHSFKWQASVPFLGALIQLCLLKALLPHFGIYSVVIASTTSLVVQWLLLMPILWDCRRYMSKGIWSHPGVLEVGHLILPLIISSFLVRWTPVVDRYLASMLPIGAVSHLSYAFRMVSVLSVLISIGLTTVVYPRFAARSARQDAAGLLNALSLSLRVLWMMVAPVAGLVAVLAVPLLALLFERGAFHAQDSLAVGHLLQIYLFSLGASCLGNVTSRAYYALKKTRLIAIIGPVEALAYAGYAYLLARQFGAAGIAWSYVIYFNVSLLWQMVVLRVQLGPLGGKMILESMCRITVAAAVCAAAAWGVVTLSSDRIIQILGGSLAGGVLYLVSLELLKAPEWHLFWKTLSTSDPQYIPQKQNSL